MENTFDDVYRLDSEKIKLTHSISPEQSFVCYVSVFSSNIDSVQNVPNLYILVILKQLNSAS